MIDLHTIGLHKSQRTLCKILNDVASKHLQRKVLSTIYDFRTQLNTIKELTKTSQLFSYQKVIIKNLCRLLYKDFCRKVEKFNTTEEIKTFWLCSMKCILLDFEEEVGLKGYV